MNCLKSFFLEQSRDDPAAIRRAIDESCDEKGWLIFSTHDVRENPSPYGCTPGFFEAVVSYAVQSGARILTLGSVCEMLVAPAHKGKS